MGDGADLAFEQELMMMEYHPYMDPDTGNRDPDSYYRLPGVKPRRAKPHSPDCGGERVLRTNSKTGAKFWGCSEFPKCRWSANHNFFNEEGDHDGATSEEG